LKPTLSERARTKLWFSVSRLGERLKVDALTYNDGVFGIFHRAALRDAGPVAEVLLETFPGTRSLADVGCGTGTFAAEFARRGVRVTACEYSPRARRWAERQGIVCVPFDVSKSTQPPPGCPVDVAMSLEVAEHIPVALADAFVQVMCGASRQVFFTAAHPGQGGQGHVNEQPQAYWISKFVARGFAHDQAASALASQRLTALGAADYLAANIMIFRAAQPA
jgi:SAM-dependent methyltransferase